MRDVIFSNPWVILLGGTSAWAAQPTITIYFGGTGVWGGWADGNISKIGAPELLSTLVTTHKQDGDQYSKFIPGVGVDYYGNENLFAMGNPSNPLGGRGWTACMDEAEVDMTQFL